MNIYSLMVGLQACIATVEISVAISKEYGNISTSRFSLVIYPEDRSNCHRNT